MKKSKFILAILIFLLALATVGCSSGVNVNDVSKNSSGTGQDSSLSTTEEKSYSITVENADNGTVTTEGGITKAVKGTNVTFVISANADYELDWIKINGGNNLKSSVKSGKLTIAMPATDVVVSVYFCKKGEKNTSSYPPYQESSSKGETYSAEILNCENGTFRLSKDSNIKAGETVYVYATPETNYVVKNVKVTTKENNSQNIPVVKNAENWSFTMPACSVNVSVEFEIQKYSINVKTTEGVSVTLDRNIASEGETVKITGVILDVGYRLVEIKVNGQTITNNEFVMPASSATVEAVVEKIEYTVDVISNENAEITLTGGLKYNYADEVSVTVLVNQGYKLKNIIVTTQEENAQTIAVNLNGNSGTFTMPACSVSISVELEKQVYDVTAKKVTGVSYTVDKTTATVGETVTISNVVTDTGIILKEFRVNEQKIESNSFVMPAENVTIEPIIEKTVYTVTIASCENGSVNLKDGVNYNYGDKVVLVLSPATDYQLDTVSVKTDSGKTVEVSNLTFTMPAENVTVTVTFKTAAGQKYTITVSSCQNGTVSVSDTSVSYNTKVTFTANANIGYELDYFLVDGAKISGNTYTVTKDITVTAVFKTKICTLTIVYRSIETSETLDTETQQMTFGTSKTITPTKSFTGYTKTTTTLNVTMDEEGKTVYVEYTINSYTLTVKHLIYNDGGEFATTETFTLKYKECKTISPVSLTAYKGIIKADATSKQVTMDAGDKTETFTYSLDTTKKLSSGISTGALKVITAKTGFSVTYKQTDNTSYAINDWCLLFAIDKCNINAGCMQWFGEDGTLLDDWYDGKHGHGDNDTYGPTYNWNAVIKEGCEYTVSFNTDGTIVWYRDGLKVLYFNADVKHSSKTIKEFVANLIDKASTVGISLGDGSVVMDGTTYKTTLSDFTIGYQVTEKTVTVNYSSTDGSIKRGSSVYKLAPGYEYTFNTALSGYTASADSVTTSTGTADETFNISYTRKASTVKTFVDKDILVARKGQYGTDGLVNINNITGDFYMEITIADLYQRQSADDIWRCLLISVFNAGTNDGRYYRFDRYSWFVNNTYGEWTQGHSWYTDNSVATQVMKGRSDVTVTISRKSGTIVVIYKIYSYATNATYYMDFTCESMSGAIDVKFGGEDCSYTLKSIKVENNSTGELSVDTSKIGTTVYNEDNSLGDWQVEGVRTSYKGLEGNFVAELNLYQYAVCGTTDMSYTNAKWRTPLLALYACDDYSKHTVLRQDGHFWMATDNTVGSNVTFTTSDSTIFLGDTSSTSTTFADIVKHAYVKIVVVGENVGQDSGKVTVTFEIYSMNPAYADTVYKLSYVISGVKAKVDVVVLCEYSSYTVYNYAITEK